MKESAKIILFSLVFLIVGLVAGMAIKNPQSRHSTPEGMHRMPDGSLMSDDGSDMHSMMMDMTERMKGKTGDELDRIFLEDMIVHHEGAIEMAKMLAANTTRPELQKMAQDIITVQSEEIRMMQGWHAAWFK